MSTPEPVPKPMKNRVFNVSYADPWGFGTTSRFMAHFTIRFIFRTLMYRTKVVEHRIRYNHATFLSRQQASLWAWLAAGYHTLGHLRRRYERRIITTKSAKGHEEKTFWHGLTRINTVSEPFDNFVGWCSFAAHADSAIYCVYRFVVTSRSGDAAGGRCLGTYAVQRDRLSICWKP